MKNLGTMATVYDIINRGYVDNYLKLRINSTAYSVDERVWFAGKNGYVLLCTTAGTTGATEPSWPTSITSGVTTITDGTVVWTIYDTSLVVTGVFKPDFPVRENLTAYSAGDRVYYLGKYSYVLVCSTAGTSGSTTPVWPSTISSGETTVSDGSVEWTIFDMADSVVDSLTSTSTKSPLSANQGKVLQDTKQRKLVSTTITTGDVDLDVADIFEITITAATSFVVTNAPTSAIFVLKITNGGTNVTWPANTKWSSGTAPDLQSSGLDVLTFLTTDGGTSWTGFKSALDVK